MRALLACLALSPGKPWPREKLMALLWSDRAEEQARASLRQALAELRRALGEPSPLRTEHDAVSLDPAMIALDAVEFERLAKAGQLGRGRRALSRAAARRAWRARRRLRGVARGRARRLHDLAVDVLDRLALAIRRRRDRDSAAVTAARSGARGDPSVADAALRSRRPARAGAAPVPAMPRHAPARTASATRHRRPNVSIARSRRGDAGVGDRARSPKPVRS